MWKKRINRRVHVSWCMAWLCIGLLVGIGWSFWVARTVLGMSELVGFGTLLLIISLHKRRMFYLVCALGAGVCFGLWRGTAERASLSAYKPLYGANLTVVGFVSEDTALGPQGDIRVRLTQLRIGNQSMPGTIWVSSLTPGDIKRGDELVVRGQLLKGFGTVPAAMYRAEFVSIIRPNPGDVARRVRDWFADSIRRAIPEPEASLSVGYLVGQHSALPETLVNQLRIVGLTHAVVASGYNLTILVAFTRRLLIKFSKYLATFAATTMILSFMLVTGFSPSMIRAGLVSVLSLLAWYYGRIIHPVVLLALAAAITAFWRPSYVWGDIGWYLSFTAFIGVIILAPLLRRYFWGNKKHISILQLLVLDTISAQLMTMPIIFYAFGQYATYALLANILILPFMPVAMLGTFIAGIAGVTVPSTAHIVGLPATLLLRSNLFVIRTIASLPGSHGEVTFGVIALIASYVGLLLLLAYLWRATGYNFRKEDDKEQITVF